MKRIWKFFLVLALVAATAGITFCVTYYELGGATGTSTVGAKTAEIQDYLENYFIDEYDETTLGDAAASAMVAATGDRWSYYISAADYASYLEQMNNAYVGIGITIIADEEAQGFTVSSVTPDGPADVGGVQAGDLLIAVEGESAWELGQEETVNRVRGEAGTEITLTFSRNGEEYDVTLVRGSIETQVATYELTEDGIAIITILNFDSNCADHTIAAVEQALKDGAKGVVFDVRNNPGGMKTELVKVLDRLLPEGVLFRSVDYSGHEEEDTSDAQYLDLPMAVLINEESYSAAEFFAAALQEYDAAVIVGTQTCGKGNFQTTFQLSDGSAIAISIGKYFTPNGVSLTDVGVTPDITVDLDDEQFLELYYGLLPMEEDPQMQAALEAVREFT